MARRTGWADAAALISYALLAVWIMGGLWADPSGRWLHNPDDQGFFQAMLAHGERVLYHGESPLFTTRLNAPAGVNLMANTSVLGVSLPLAPVTHVFGPAVAVALMATLGLAGTAFAWWWVLSRHLVASRAGAWTGGLWAGFAPGFVAHANGQPNFTCGYVIPFITWQTIRLREPGRVWRGGVLLGLLIAYQVFVNEELLLLLAITLTFVGLFRAALGRRLLAGLLVAAGTAGALLAYPLHQQFFGTGHYRGVPFRLDLYGTTLGAIPAFPRRSIAGSEAVARQVTGGSVTEDATFWGPGVCVMVLVAVVLLWRSAAARATALAGVVLLLMSFGSRLRRDSTTTLGPAPFGWTEHVPLLDLVTTPRYALAATVIVGVLLALAADRVRRHGRALQGVFWAGIALALVPMFPLQLRTQPAPVVPAFFAQGMWRGYVHGEQSIVIVPLPAMVSGRAGMRIAALSHLDFPVPRGYFVGPADPPGDNRGSWIPPRLYTVNLLDEVRRTSHVPKLGPAERRAVRADLRYWRAGIVVVLPDAPNRLSLRRALYQVLGTPVPVGGVFVFKVPQFIGP